MYNFSDREEPCRYRTYITHDSYGSHERRGEPIIEDSKRSWTWEIVVFLIVGMGMVALTAVIVWLLGGVSWS